ncbi:MAG TPA: GFA family protein [Candidatus Paceibacterota bacterium]|jgi:hypothetical protein|nr:GFA family protein [Candidatus Paceibacterota bacterium]
MQTYTGGCHCGAVKYEVETDLAKVIECNCTHCDIKGLILSFVPEDKFKLLSGEDNLENYQFNKKKIHHLFCQTCGVESFGRGENSKGEKLIAINVRCLNGVDRSKLTITPVDGKQY